MNPAAGFPPAGQRRLILAAVVLGTIIQVLDSSICAITLPLMKGSLAATQDQISWVMTAYIVAVVMITPLTGALAVRLGRRTVLLAAVVGFTVAALGAAQSTSLAELVIFRFVQGLFGGFLMPVGQTVLLDALPPSELALGMGWRSTGTMLGMSVGPPIGGLIIEYFSWRWSFYINLPFAVVAFAMIWRFVPETRPPRHEPVSWLGYAFLAVAIGALQLMLSRGQRLDWFAAPEIVASAWLTVLGFYLFALHALVARRPFIELGIFRDRTFTTGVALVFLFTWLMFNSQILLPAYLQDLRGYPVSEASVVMAARAAATMIFSIVAGWLMTHMGPRRIIVLGVALMVVGYWQMSLFTADAGWNTIMIASAVFGAGSGLSFVPLNVTTFATLTPRYRDLGTSVFALSAMIGGSSGISVMVTQLVRAGQAHHAELAARASPFNEALRHLPLPERWALDTAAGLAAVADEVQRQALMLAYVGSFRWLALVGAACIPLVYFMRRPRQRAIPAPAPAR